MTCAQLWIFAGRCPKADCASCCLLSNLFPHLMQPPGNGCPSLCQDGRADVSCSGLVSRSTHSGAPVLLCSLLVPGPFGFCWCLGCVRALCSWIRSLPSVLLPNYTDINCHPVLLKSVCLGEISGDGCNTDFRAICAWWHCKVPQLRVRIPFKALYKVYSSATCSFCTHW